MSEANRHHLGIDFGTANSFLAIATEGHLSATPIDFGQDELRSIVLYRKGESGDETVIAFGQQAEHEWGMATPDEKRLLRLASQFKADIASDDETPRKDAESFLRCVANDLTQRGVLPSGKKPSEIPVLIGTPANAMAGFDETLDRVARDAGLGAVELVKEPIGALISHLSRHEFSARDARGGLLVIDFGGGTCDVAYMLRLEVREAWGDPILGGRLFDDLFYQWFCDENPDAAQVMARDGDSYYVHWVRCREMKERFSETLARDRQAAFRYAVPPYGRLGDATWEQFLERARDYTPSPSFREELGRLGPAYHQLTSGGAVDLVAWVQGVIGRGIADGKIRVDDVSFVILTGGSSAWPFVRETVAEALQIPPDKILSSASPRRAIGEGVALLPVLKKRYEQIIREIKDECPGKVEEILREVQHIAGVFLDELAAELSGRFIGLIEPPLSAFRKTGGRLSDLEAKITAQGATLDRVAAELVQKRSPELAAKMNQRIRDILAPWFESKHIHWTPESIPLSPAGPDRMSGPRVPVDDLCMTGLTTITSTVMAVVLGTLCGGAGTAWVVAGPVGWIVGGVLGVILTVAVAWGGRRYAEETTKSIPIPAKLAWLALRKISYDKIRKDMEIQLLKDFRPKLYSQQADLRRHVEQITRAQIDDIGALDQL